MKYEITLWVTLAEEVAILQLFQGKGWPYVKFKNEKDKGLFTSQENTIKIVTSAPTENLSSLPAVTHQDPVIKSVLSKEFNVETDHDSYTQPEVFSDTGDVEQQDKLPSPGNEPFEASNIDTDAIEYVNEEVYTTDWFGDENTLSVSEVVLDSNIESCELVSEEIIVDNSYCQDSGSSIHVVGKMADDLDNSSVVSLDETDENELPSNETDPSGNNIASGMDAKYTLVVDFKSIQNSHHNKVPIPKENKELAIRQIKSVKGKIMTEDMKSFDKMLLVIAMEVDGEVKSVCCMCMKGFDDLTAFSTHADSCVYNLMKRNKSSKYKCTSCPNGFWTVSSLLLHRLSLVCQPGVIQRDGNFVTCRTCDKRFPIAQMMMYSKHLLKHRDERAFKCDTCGKTYLHESALKIHKNSHEGLRPYKCRYCTATFSSAAARCGHEECNHLPPPKRSICEKCGSSFKFLRGLKTHMKEVHSEGDPSHKCGHCDMMFKRRCTRNRHEKQHTDSRNCICDICGKAFFRLWELKMHIRRHNNERTLFCNECGKGFYTNHTLREHKQLHTHEKTFKCSVCDFRSKTRGYFKKHVKEKHPQALHTIDTCPAK